MYVKDGKVVDLKGMPEFPLSQGRLCAKGLAAKELLYDPKRLRYPMKREGETWVRISWDEALETIARRLMDVKEKYGAKALSVIRGSILEHEIDPFIRRFVNVYGSPNLAGNLDMCVHPRMLADKLTLGASAFRFRDFRKTKCILVWGVDPSTSNPMAWKDVVDAKERGARLIVIDPRFTNPASKADLYVCIRPGTDGALALGMLNVIIGEGLYDKNFVENWTIGFDELKEHVKCYTAGQVEEITSVPANIVKEVARTYATAKPAYIDLGNALDTNANTFQTLRSIGILRAITGNIDVPGGNVFGPNVPLKDISLREKLPPDMKPLGTDKYPLFTNMFGVVPSGVLIETLFTGKPYPIKSAIVDFSNLMLTWPDTKKIEAGLKKLDFLVVMDIFMTKTAELADIVLPAATFLERVGVFTYCRGVLEQGKASCYVMLKNKAVEPTGECWPDWKFWFELAKRMGYRKRFPWDNIEEAIDFRLKPTGITIEELKKHPSGVYYGALLRYKKYEEEGFGTPSGKVEIYCERLKTLGYDPLPVFREPAESPVGQPRLAKEYPLILTTGAKTFAYSHSSYRGLSSLRKITPEPLAEIHPKTAKELGMTDGEYAIIETLRGKIEIKVKLTGRIHPHCVSIPHGWEQANANTLTNSEIRDPVTGSPNLRSLPCRVRKKAEIS